MIHKPTIFNQHQMVLINIQHFFRRSSEVIMFAKSNLNGFPCAPAWGFWIDFAMANLENHHVKFREININQHKSTINGNVQWLNYVKITRG